MTKVRVEMWGEDAGGEKRVKGEDPPWVEVLDDDHGWVTDRSFRYLQTMNIYPADEVVHTSPIYRYPDSPLLMTSQSCLDWELLDAWDCLRSGHPLDALGCLWAAWGHWRTVRRMG